MPELTPMNRTEEFLAGNEGGLTPMNRLEYFLDNINTGLDQKANVDGYYEGMAVGRADNLISESKITEKVPYLYRPSGGNADIDWQAYDMPTGVSLNVNQIVADGDFASNVWTTAISGWKSMNASASSANNVASITAESSGGRIEQKLSNPIVPSGHVFLYAADVKASSNTVKLQALRNDGAASIANAFHSGSGAWERLSILNKHSQVSGQSPNMLLYIRDTANSDWTTFYAKNCIFVDLTNILTPTVANYANTLESGTAGAGVSWLYQHFPWLKGYIAYSAGYLQSVKTSAHKMVGFNHYNPATGTAKLCGGYQWQITGEYTALSYSTGETLTPDANGKFTPTDDGILTITGGDDSTTCVHLAWDGSRDGEWEQYTEWNYPLDDDLTLRGYLKLDADNNLYSDGDTYASDGTVTRKRYSITFDGSEDEDWRLATTGSARQAFRYVELPYAKKATTGNIDDCIVGGDIPLENSAENTSGSVITCRGTSYESKIFYVFMPLSPTPTVESLRTYLQAHPITFEYPLATPQTESADPYTNPQRVDNWGTEEYVDGRTIPIPVGHSTEYGVDDKAKLESAPNIPAQDGTYVVKVQSGVASYVALITPTELPPAPTTDGTYTLKVTVASGTPTYTWAS